MTTELANKIVDLRKTTGKIQDFSDLWCINEMNRRTMHELTKHFVIEQSAFLDKMNTSNNANKRQTPRKRKQNSKKQKGRKDMKLLEHIPLLNMSTDSFTGSDRMTILTPRIVESSPSGEKILAVYEVTPSKKLSSDETKDSSKMSTRNNAASTSRFSVNSRQNLSPTKEKSIRNWLNNSNAYRSLTSKWTKPLSKKRSRSQKYSALEVKRNRATPNKTSIINRTTLRHSAKGKGNINTKTKTVTISNHSSPIRIKDYRQHEQTAQKGSEYTDNSDMKRSPIHGRPRREKVMSRRRRSVSADSREILIRNKSPYESAGLNDETMNKRKTAKEHFVDQEYTDSFPNQFANTSAFCNEMSSCRRHSVSPMRRRHQDRQSPDRQGHSNDHSHHHGRSKGHHRSHHPSQWNAASECIII